MERIPQCRIHPISIKLIKKGHPWVTKDKFSLRFPKDSPFIVALDEKQKPFALLIHDPSHRKIKGRVWSLTPPFAKEVMNFTVSLKARLDISIHKRLSQKSKLGRENFYLVFGEVDKLPGLNILRLKDRVLVQYYGLFWKTHQSIIKETLLENIPQLLEENIWFQNRGETRELQKRPVNSVEPHRRDEFFLEEFGVQYLIRLGATYDHGLYSDMSAIRKKLSHHINSHSVVLNLYSYTGAYSLWALKNNAKKVYSVDLSPKYLEWLQNNLDLNNDLDHTKHFSVLQSVQEALKEFAKKKKKFNIIICDPPSSSSDGEKKSSAIKAYKELLQKMDLVLEANGILIVFLNTHQINHEKFLKIMMENIKELKLNYNVKEKLFLREDCPTMKNFPEGNYLKGLVLQKMNF